MSRRKDKVIEKIEHGPFSAVIRLTDEGQFTCEYGALKFSGTLPDARTWARETLRGIGQLDWIAVMCVNVDTEDHCVNNIRTSSNLSIWAERYWIAWTGKKWIECPWVVDRPGVSMCIGPANSDRDQDEMPEQDLQAERLRRSRDFHDGPDTETIVFPLVNDSCNGKTYVVRYTEDNWQTMAGIMDKLRELRARLNQMLATADGWAQLQLATRAIGLLGAPDEKRPRVRRKGI